jgi:squalene-hopene/tetraprenyl-beta-curcumene cyclase
MLDGVRRVGGCPDYTYHSAPFLDETRALDASVRSARQALLALQHAEGYWSFELEADCTIPAEYVLMMHFMGEIDWSLQTKLAAYIRAHQTADGGWPLYHGGDFDLSCTVKAYYALKLAGDDPQALHMQQARQTILAHGGAARVNVFTRIALAFFGQVPWRAVPFMPVEIILLPRWFPFHIDKVSYWSRTVMVPLLILCSLKAHAKNPFQVHICELFVVPPEEEDDYFPARSGLNRLFLALDRAGRWLEPSIPRRIRARALKRAENWMIERLNGRGGLGAIFPAMVNAYEALAWLGYPAGHPYCVQARQALQDLLVIGERSAYCQPCVSPVWDTALSCLALQAAGGGELVERALEWLRKRQLLTQPGDWRRDRPSAAGGGWPFQLQNSYYPDTDDTGAVAWAMMQADAARFDASARQAAEWIASMQSCNGGFAAFDADNTHYYLNAIPFADHGALLDPPTADVSARCAVVLHRFAAEDSRYRRALERCIAFLREEQEPEGPWYGRWGTNYIYGTWSVLTALAQAGVPPDDPTVQRAVQWLKEMQRPDGGWGESNDSYLAEGAAMLHPCKSTAFQTAWAMLALMAAGQADGPEVRRGAHYLMYTQQADGLWQDEAFTAPGFPRVFYLKYHGYQKYFPLWALACYRKLRGDAQW